jgi:heme A synthase
VDEHVPVNLGGSTSAKIIIMARLARFAWSVLLFNLGVIAWGAYVRATRSGAGCGAHWPLCNGEVVPQAPGTAMLVEFTHRASSGLALLAVVGLLVWTWRATRPGDPARRAAAWAMLFMVTEAAVGAALVLFRLVADNATMARAGFMSVHLVNTFLLLASLALAAYWLSGGAPVRVAGRGGTVVRLAAGSVGLLLAGTSGAVAALGDTLYPAGSLAQALGAELSATSHLLVRLRLFHPGIALVAAVVVIVAGVRAAHDGPGPARRLGVGVVAATGIQATAGFLNVLLLAPVWMQLVHLLIADAVWIGYVLLAAASLRAPAPASAPLARWRNEERRMTNEETRA